MIDVTINGMSVSVEQGATVLDAAKQAGVYIPTLCHMDLHDTKMINQVGTCRVCMVEVDGRRNLMPACSTPIAPGMTIHTNTNRAIRSRRMMVELLLSNHPKDCLVCDKNQDCELQSLAAELGVRDIPFQGKMSHWEKDTSSLSLVRDPEKCVLCRRCETMCNEVQTVGVYSAVGRGFDTTMGTAFGLPMMDTECTFCGQCVSVCPTGALSLKDNVADVWKEIADPEKVVIVQTAPAVRAALGESFGMEPGTSVTGKMVAGLRRIGFDHVYDTDFAADMTIMEEASELVHRIQHGGKLPILTSCCPAWVKFFEHQFPDLLDIPSTCKSPQQMFGAVAKTYLAEKLGVDPKKMVVVSVMPCLAKKFEAARPELGENDMQDVDYVLSTREAARMMREAGINFSSLPDEDFDKVMGESTGASVIFGTTGGVIEAAVRTAAWMLEGKNREKVDFTALRGIEGVREATVNVAGLDLKIAIVHGLGNARALLDDIRAGKVEYQAIEIMACPMGCVGGGGQPFHHSDSERIKARAAALYAEDAGKPVRCSHENVELKKFYDEYLGEPYGEKAHHLLHTHYHKRELV